MQEALGRRAVNAILRSVAQRLTVRLSGFTTVVILARMLSPADFGTVAVAASILPVIYLLADMGFSTYIVQAADIGPQTLSTAFWLRRNWDHSGIRLAASGPLLAMVFNDPGPPRSCTVWHPHCSSSL